MGKFDRGIIVASDRKQEWLLPWWWQHYSTHNSYPVAFFDFGMSRDALAWCKEKGKCFSIPDAKPLKNLSPRRKAQWLARWGEGIWHFRSAWFKKPLACFLAPFTINCWIDLDCQVLGSLAELFHLFPDHADIAMIKEIETFSEAAHTPNYLLPDEATYNSGVIVFRKKAPIIAQWMREAEKYNDRFLGDQNVLSRLIYLHKNPFFELPRKFNWLKSFGPNPEAVVLHYVAFWKLEILRSLHPELVPK